MTACDPWTCSGERSGRAHDRVGDGDHLAVLAGDPEVAQHGALAALLDQDVAWRHIAVDDAEAVGVVEGRGDLAEDRQGRVELEPALLLDQLAQRAPADVLQQRVEEGLAVAVVVELDDVGVAQPRGDGGLALEAADRLAVLRHQHLHGHLVLGELGVVRQPDLA